MQFDIKTDYLTILNKLIFSQYIVMMLKRKSFTVFLLRVKPKKSLF